MQEGYAETVARARWERPWMSEQRRPNQTHSVLGREQNLSFTTLEHVEALERRQRKVLIKINYKIGTIKNLLGLFSV